MANQFRGRILDTQGNPLTGAQVVLTSGDITKTTTTSKDGEWSIEVKETIDPLNTTVVISKENYSQTVITNPQVTSTDSSDEWVYAKVIPEEKKLEILKEFYLTRRTKCDTKSNEEYISKLISDLSKTPDSKLPNGRFPDTPYNQNIGVAGKTKQEIINEKKKTNENSFSKYCGGFPSSLPPLNLAAGVTTTTVALSEQNKLEYSNEAARTAFNIYLGWDPRENIFSDNEEIIQLTTKRLRLFESNPNFDPTTNI
jgi:hypothetical protein